MDNTQNNQQPPRPPGKYRSSCDACQSSKVRCSQEKPSCRRCTVQDVECVYSLSRRMGRPRQKNKDAPAATERKETTGPSSTTPGRAEMENNTSPSLSTSMAMTTSMTTANLTSTTQEDDSIAVAIASANNNHSSNGSVSSITGSSLGNNSTSPLMLKSDTPGDMSNDFIGDMDLDGVLASEMLDFAAFRDLQVPPLGIDCNDGGMGMDMNMGFSQFSDAASLLGFGPGPLPMGGMDSMMGFGMGDMTPLDPATPLSMADSMSDTSGTGTKPRMSQPTSNPSVSNYVPPLPMRSDCSCYSTVLRLVASSQAHQHSTTATTIDSILGLEDDTKHMLSDLLKCHNCMRDPCVQLLAIVSVSTTLKLLRHAANYKLKPPSQRRLTMQSGLPLTPGSSPQDCNLYVGKFRVTDEMRAGFVRQVLSARVRRLLAELEGVFSNLRSLPQDAMSGAAIMVADDTYNELQTITGWIELWN